MGGDEVGKASKDYILREWVSHQRVLRRQVLSFALLRKIPLAAVSRLQSLLGGKVEEIIAAKTKKERSKERVDMELGDTVCHSATTLLGRMSSVNQIVSPVAADFLLER